MPLPADHPLADGRTGTSALVQAARGVRTAVSAIGGVLDDALVLRGNRIIVTPAQNVVVNALTSGSIDARRNWWGRSAGLPSSAFNGPVDASEPLRLVGVRPAIEVAHEAALDRHAQQQHRGDRDQYR